MKVAWIIRLHRQVNQIDQSVVAAAIGVAQSTYQRMETGKNAILLPHFFAICDAITLDPVAVMKAVLA